MAPSTMKAIKCVDQGKATLQDVPLPTLRPDYILIKTTAVALNPTDWKHIDFLSSPNATVGCDYAGTVIEVGSSVPKPFKPGDRIAGFAHGVNALEPQDGAFAEYIVAKGNVQMHTPANLSDEEAATLGVGITTVGQGLYQSLGLPVPSASASEIQKTQADTDKAPWVLIYGGSTATGSLAIQYARLSGWRVVVTCSPHNNDFCMGLGAEKAFDYRDPNVGAEIRKYTNNGLHKVFDCISEGESPRICGEALAEGPGGTVSFLLPATCPREDVESKRTLGYTVFGEEMSYRGQKMEAKPEDEEFGKMWWDLSTTLLAEGRVKVHTPEVRKGGLEGVFGGLDDLRKGKVSGVKLVYKI